ncbi:MAG: hypothetical protein ACSHW0_15370 [Thalassotalea sp.]
MIYFCCNEKSITTNIEGLGRVILKTNAVDQLLFNHSALYDKKFQEHLTELNNFIQNNDNVPIKRWFEACEFYVELIKNNFVDETTQDFISKITSDIKNKNFYSESENHTRSFKLNDAEICNLFKIENKKLQQQAKKIRDDELFKKLEISWQGVEEEINTQFRSSDFINKFTANEWFTAIRKWQFEDVGNFTYFIRERYNSQNISESLSNEIAVLEDLQKLLELEIATLQGQQKGTLTMLNNAITVAITQLSPKNPNT